MRHSVRMVPVVASVVAVLLSACARQTVSHTTALPGGATPTVDDRAPNTVGGTTAKATVDGFLFAVNKQDLQAMSGLWGNAKGLAREQLKRDELEKRLIVIQCLLQNDRYRYLEDRPRLAMGGRQDFLVELTRGPAKAETHFTTVQTKDGRWLIEDVDVTKLRDFCR